MIGQSVGAYTNATHGMTLSAVSLAYYRHICPDGLRKFARFAKNVWGVESKNKSDRQIAAEGLSAMESWMRELGLIMHIGELGAKEDMLADIADGVFITNGGYKLLTKNDVIEILKESL